MPIQVGGLALAVLATFLSQDPSRAERERQRQRLDSIYVTRIAGPLYRDIVYARNAADWGRLVTLYDTVLKYEPRRGSAYYGRAYAKMQLGDEAGSKRDLDRAQELGFRRYPLELVDVHPIWLRANQAHIDGNLRDALRDYDSVLKFDSMHWRAYGGRAKIHLQFGDTTAALVDLRDASRFTESPVDRAEFDELALKVQGDSVRAAAYRKALERPRPPSRFPFKRLLEYPIVWWGGLVVAAILLDTLRRRRRE